MKKNKLFIVFLLLIIIIQIISGISAAAGDDDPVVTLSYIEKKFAGFKEYVDSKVSNGSNSSPKFEVVNVKAGTKVIFTEKSVEFILRSGQGSAIGSENGGLADLTEGYDLKSGKKVELNHLMLVPRNDGRGVLAETDIWIMIKGKYEFR